MMLHENQNAKIKGYLGQTASHDGEEPDRQSQWMVGNAESDRHQDWEQADKFDDHDLTLINARASIVDQMNPMRKRVPNVSAII